MSKLKSYCRNLITSSHEVEEIVDVLTRARRMLSHNRYALTAQLIQQAENKLELLGKEKENERSAR